MLYPAELRAPQSEAIAVARSRRQLLRLAMAGPVLWAIPLRPGRTFERQGLVVGEHLDEQMNLRLTDGRVLRQASIHVPQVKTSDALWRPRLSETLAVSRELLVGEPLELTSPSPYRDRVGRIVTRLRRIDGVDPAHELLRRGLAVFRPDLGSAPDASRLASLERQAREARRGLWRLADPPIEAHWNAQRLVGSYGIVWGRALRVAEARRYHYVNFGDQWREDFTIRVPNKALRRLAKSDFEIMKLEGRKIEARGWVFEENGPMIEMTNRNAVEIVR